MFNNYLKIIIRNLSRNPLYSFINISGLAIGMASAILILLWVQDELSYDRFHQNADRIYRLVVHDNNLDYAISHAPVGRTLKEEYPEVTSAVRLSIGGDPRLFGCQNKLFKQQGREVTSDFFEVFTFPFIQGDAKMALSAPNSIVITRELAQKCFGNANALGKTITLDGSADCVISGVIENIPQNSHLKFDFLCPAELSTNWGDWSYYTYIVLDKDCSIESMNQKINATIKKYKPGTSVKYDLQPLTRIHLFSDFKFDVEGNSDIQYVYIFSLVGILILVVGCINFINLSTARCTNRAREVGIRKTIGSNRNQLIKQFLCESFVFSFLAFIIALILVETLLPFYCSLSGKELKVIWFDSQFMLGALLLILTTGILAGGYPAFVVSAFNPIETLKSGISTNLKGIQLRKLLVVLQFTCSVGLIIATIVAANQLSFMQNAKLGFDKENLIYLPLSGRSRDVEKVESLKNEFIKNPNIINATASRFLPNQSFDGTTGAVWEGKKTDESIQMAVLTVDNNYLDTYQMEMAQGRFYSKDHLTDPAHSIVLNETAINAMGLESPIGKNFIFDGNRQIVGVVKDFHFRSLSEEIAPLIIRLTSQNWHRNYLTLRIKPVNSNFSELINYIENQWTQINPDYPFEFHFLDETLDRAYAAEQRLNRIFYSFAFWAIIIAGFGLFGLALFNIEKRTKEIGIRKALGASVPSLISYLSWGLIKWVILANFIAWPLAWFAMNQWLKNFAYRIEMSWWMFALAGSLALVIALLTVSWQAILAARANPVQALRYE